MTGSPEQALTRDDDTAPAALTLRLAGVPLLAAAGRPGVALERKTAATLWWLVTHGPVRRDRLAQLLWPSETGVDAAAARANLRQVSFRLKRIAGGVMVDGREELALTLPVALEPGPPGATLLEGCDFADCPELAALLDDARARHRLQDQNQRLADAAAAEAQGDLAQAEQLARQLLGEDALCEAAHRQLIRALYLRGDRAAALAAGQACRAALEAGLGVAPDEATLALLQDVQRGTRGGAAAPSAPLQAGAAHRLPVSVLRPPRMVGRERERQALRQMVAPGQLVLLRGEAGLGKSRLLQELFDGPGEPPALCTAARPGDAVVVLSTLARSLRALLAWRPEALALAFAERLPRALAQLLPELAGAPPAGDEAEPALHRTVATLMARSGPPATWVLDDLHHADEASVEVLRQLSDDESLAGWAWLCACRPAEGSAAARAWLQQRTADGRLPALDLAPLDEPAIAELLDSLGLPGLDAQRWAPLLRQRTGGNPLFLLETLKSALGRAAGLDDASALPTPQPVAALIAQRLQQLSPDARALARVAALAGPDFDAALAARVLERPALALADAWRELEDAQVLRDQAFAHDLILEATLADVPAPIQRHTHRAIAEHLEHQGAEPARLAAHWLAAGQPARAAPHLEAAAQRAEARVCYAEALALQEQAAAAHDACGNRAASGAARLRLAGLLSESNQPAAALALLEQLSQSGLPADLSLRVTVEHMHQLAHAGRTAQALELGQRVLADEAQMEEAGDIPAGTLRQAVADMLMEVGRAGEALPLLESIQGAMDDPEHPERRAWFRSSLGRAQLDCGQAGAAEQSYELALESARRHGRHRQMAGVLLQLASVQSLVGRLLAPLDTMQEALRLVSDSGPGAFMVQVLQVRSAAAMISLGRYQEILDLLDPLAARMQGAWLFNLHCILARSWAALGQPQRAGQAWAQACELGSVSSAVYGHATGMELAWLASGGQPSGMPQNSPFDLEHLTRSETLQVSLLQARAVPETADTAALIQWRDQAQESGMRGLALWANLLACRSAARQGQADEARQLGREVLNALRQATPVGLYRAGLWHGVWNALRMVDPVMAAEAAHHGAEWVRNVARLHVPAAYRRSFLESNRMNVDLLAAAASR